MYCVSSNAVLLITLCSVNLLLKSYEPFERGFFCDDESIKYPFKENDTVSLFNLLLITLLLSVLTIICFEIIFYLLTTKELPFKDVEFTLQTLSILSDWFLATCVNYILTDIPKNKIDRLTPMFMNAYSSDVDCSSSLNTGKYITDFDCLRETDWTMKQLQRSFPAGHSSESMVAMTYIAIYLHKRFGMRDFFLYFVIVLQLLFLMIAIFTGLSRIQDYRRHWSDVSTGFAIRGSVALVIAKLTRKLDDLIDRRQRK